MFLLEALQPDQLVNAGFGGMFGLIAGMLMFFVIFGILVWVYTSLAFMQIAKKTSYPTPALAWIPLVGPALIASSAAQMHWWPILLVIGTYFPIVGMFFYLAFLVFSTIWMWKTFEALERPGWWAILLAIPFVNLIGLILLGVAAWGGQEK